MKKTLALVLVLAFLTAGALFAQEWDFWGSATTGLKFTTFGGFGQSDWDGPDYNTSFNEKGILFNEPEYWTWGYTNRKPYAPALTLTSGDDGNYVDLNAMYTHRNWGFYASARFILFMENPFELHGLYLWYSFLNDDLTLKLGRVKDHVNLRQGRDYIEALFGLWSAPGAKDHEYSYSEGDGLRIEYTGIPGLNAGIGLFIPDLYHEYYMGDSAWDSNNGMWMVDEITGRPVNYYRQQIGFNGWMENAKNVKLIDILKNITIGGEYRTENLHAAVGFKLDSPVDALDVDWNPYFGHGLWNLFDGPVGPKTAPNLPDDIDKNNIDWYIGRGMKAYFGVHVQHFQPWSFKLGGQFSNLGAFSEVGKIQLNQTVSYELGWRYGGVSLSAIQTIYNIPDDRRDGFAWRFDDVTSIRDFDNLDSAKGSLSKVMYTVQPSLDFFPAGGMHAGISIPITWWPGIVNYDIALKPSFTYFTGRFLEKGFSFTAEYIFNMIQFSKYSGDFRDVGATEYRNSQPLITNALQLTASVSF
ncbi:MAG: hypothetical protein FWG89_02775 [Treponema sp.]|nr:hypothetical protein [Treponema sp.]